MNIPELIEEAHQNSIDHGFYLNGKGTNIGEKLMLIVSELSEALEADRKNRYCDISKLIHNPLENYEYPQWHHDFTHFVKDTMADEISDAYIRLFDLCGYVDINPFPEKITGIVNWESDNIGDRLRQISREVLSIEPKYISNIDEQFKILTVFIYLKDFSSRLNIPIEQHIKAKMAFNKTREHKHGKEY